jgi:hypothetical protein
MAKQRKTNPKTPAGRASAGIRRTLAHALVHARKHKCQDARGALHRARKQISELEYGEYSVRSLEPKMKVKAAAVQKRVAKFCKL